MNLKITKKNILITIIVIPIIILIAGIIITEYQYKQQAKRFYNALDQLNKAMTINHSKYSYDISTADNYCGINDKPRYTHSVCAIINYAIKDARMIDENSPDHPRNYIKRLKDRNGLSLYGDHIDRYIAYHMPDGSIVAFPKLIKNCSKNSWGEVTYSNRIFNVFPFPDECLGFIDINGRKGPNRVVYNSTDFDTNKIAKLYNRYNIFQSMPEQSDDIFPILFHDEIIAPGVRSAFKVYCKAAPKNGMCP